MKPTIVLILLWAEGALTSRLRRHKARLNHRPRSFRATPADRFEAAPAQSVVVDEERLNLIQEARTQFIKVLNMSMRAGAGWRPREGGHCAPSCRPLRAARPRSRQ